MSSAAAPRLPSTCVPSQRPCGRYAREPPRVQPNRVQASFGARAPGRVPLRTSRTGGSAPVAMAARTEPGPRCRQSSGRLSATSPAPAVASTGCVDQARRTRRDQQRARDDLRDPLEDKADVPDQAGSCHVDLPPPAPRFRRATEARSEYGQSMLLAPRPPTRAHRLRRERTRRDRPPRCAPYAHAGTPAPRCATRKRGPFLCGRSAVAPARPRGPPRFGTFVQKLT